jgi:hypothetical protein
MCHPPIHRLTCTGSRKQYHFYLIIIYCCVMRVRYGNIVGSTTHSLTYARVIITYLAIPFRCFLGDVRRECMQRLSPALHSTMGSYLCDAFQEGSADAAACLHVPRP